MLVLHSQLDVTAGSIGKDSSGAGSEEYIILLADKWLLEMPLEALALISSTNFTSISRDFSLQMMHHRVHKEPEGMLVTICPALLCKCKICKG